MWFALSPLAGREFCVTSLACGFAFLAARTGIIPDPYGQNLAEPPAFSKEFLMVSVVPSNGEYRRDRA